MEDNLAYWNMRAVEARIDVDEDESAQSCEMLAFTRAMVAIIEAEVFKVKGTK